MFPNDNILQHLCQSRLKSFEGVGGLDTLASEPPHFTGVRGISQERYERVREKRSVTVRHEQASHAILNHIGRAAVRTANHGLAMRHGFQKYKAESFSAAGQCENITLGIACE